MGTSLPELVTSMVAASKGYPNVSIGNVIGLILFIILSVGAVIGFVANIWASTNSIFLSVDDIGIFCYVVS